MFLKFFVVHVPRYDFAISKIRLGWHLESDTTQGGVWPTYKHGEDILLERRVLEVFGFPVIGQCHMCTTFVLTCKFEGVVLSVDGQYQR